MRLTLATVLTACFLAVTGVASTASSATASTAAPFSPVSDPPGANDWSCRPTTKHPTPVILVHGTFGDRQHLLERLSSSIKDAGFCVYSLDYGHRGTKDIKSSAERLGRFTEKVLRSTGAAKVSMVGHSQGGMMPRYYIKFLDGAKVVDDLVGLSPSNHGTALVGGANPFTKLVGYACRACVQQSAGSPFLTKLNKGDETPGRVSYTNVTTRFDEVVVPHTSGYLTPGRRTTNITIQDRCPLALIDHVIMPTSTPAIDIALDALTRRGPARASFRPGCI